MNWSLLSLLMECTVRFSLLYYSIALLFSNSECSAAADLPYQCFNEILRVLIINCKVFISILSYYQSFYLDLEESLHCLFLRKRLFYTHYRRGGRLAEVNSRCPDSGKVPGKLLIMLAFNDIETHKDTR